MIKDICKISFISLLAVVTAFGWTQDGEYGTPGDYLYELGPDARELGKGGGSAALVENSGSIYINPAGLGSVERADILAAYVRLNEDFNYYFGSFAYPFGKFGTVAIGLAGIGTGGIPEIDTFGIEHGEYSAFDNTFAVSYGIRFIDRINIGLNIKIATQSVADESGAGVGVDWGATIKAFNWLHFGLGMSHLGGPKITLISEEDSYANTARLGIGFKLLSGKLKIHADGMIIDFISDKEKFKDDIYRAMRWNAGVEYDIIEYLSARVGLNDRQFTFGTSFNVSDFSISYAGLVHLEDKDFRSPLSHAVSVHYSFGKPIPEKEAQLDKKLKEVDQIEKLNEVQNLFVMGYYQKAFDGATELRNENPNDKKVAELYERVRVKLAETKSVELIKNIEVEIAAKRYEEVKILLTNLLEIAPEDSVAIALNQKMIALGTVNDKLVTIKTLYAQKKYEEVEKEVNIILSVDSTNAEAKDYQTKISGFVKKRDADDHYRKAYELYHGSKDVEAASAELKKSLALIPDHKEANTLFEKISAEMKEIYLKKVGKMASDDKLDVDDEALKKLMEIDVAEQIQQARKELDEGLITQAGATINSVLKNEPQNESALALQKQIEDKQNKLKAESLYNEALREFNNQSIEKAEELVTEAANLSTDDEKINNLLMEIKKKKSAKNITLASDLLSSGEKVKIEEAKTLMDEFLTADPENGEALQLKKDISVELIIIEANEYIDNDQYEQADRTIQKALAIDPDNEKAKAAFKNIKDVINLFVE